MDVILNHSMIVCPTKDINPLWKEGKNEELDSCWFCGIVHRSAGRMWQSGGPNPQRIEICRQSAGHCGSRFSSRTPSFCNPDACLVRHVIAPGSQSSTDADAASSESLAVRSLAGKSRPGGLWRLLGREHSSHCHTVCRVAQLRWRWQMIQPTPACSIGISVATRLSPDMCGKTSALFSSHPTPIASLLQDWMTVDSGGSVLYRLPNLAYEMQSWKRCCPSAIRRTFSTTIPGNRPTQSLNTLSWKRVPCASIGG